MSVPATCKQCGLHFTSRAFSFQNCTNVNISDCHESCPRCGGIAEIQSGAYDFVGNAISAFRAPGVTLDTVLRFRDVVTSVKNGGTSSSDAQQQVHELGNAFVALWKWTNNNGGALSVLLALIALYVTIAAGIDGDESTERQLTELQKQTTIQQLIVSELQKINAADSLMATPVSPVPALNRSQQLKRHSTDTPTNRHERRKAAKLARCNRTS